MGGALLQAVDRDTQKFAMKASSARINGVDVDVQKDLATDPGKKSKAGRVTLWQCGGEWVSGVDASVGWADRCVGDWTDALEEVFRDGKWVKELTFEEVRANAAK